MWAGRHVVLGVSGGIACYKSCILARRLVDAGARVDAVLTAGRRGVRPAADIRGAHRAPRPELPLGAGRGARACPAGPGGRPRHRGAGHGAPDRPDGPGPGRRLLTALLLARTAPLLLAPAMNDEMFAHPATQANLDTAARARRGDRRAGNRPTGRGTVGAARTDERAGDDSGPRGQTAAGREPRRAAGWWLPRGRPANRSIRSGS